MKTPAVKRARMQAQRMKGFQLSKFAACIRASIDFVDDVDDQYEDKECHLLKLLHDGLVECKADDEGDAQEKDCANDIHHQVDGEVAYLGDS